VRVADMLCRTDSVAQPTEFHSAADGQEHRIKSPVRAHMPAVLLSHLAERHGDMQRADSTCPAI